ncbi:YesN/AraC family two-component response regulator [Lactobacillus colini]|uniref:YesN/AraC family two-component response regulator n=1 Tax=Lactobacillus colini TaxID=1819254 RepID=A0ABS4MC10_9LACO|nr:AraC family ligand binding domain-containing protein [Lactobacillus colini]MBP2057148.1 YesN/AraC family two-component response regulator [Lactobacillus colini]
MKFLDNILFQVDNTEKEQLIVGRNINDLDDKYTEEFNQELERDPNAIIHMPRSFFDHNQDILVSKHHRFSVMPTHKHNFVEMNYIYSGNCTQYINDETVLLHEHSLLMLDKNISHSIDYMNKDDILVNILLKDGNSINSILDTISSSPNIVTQFLFNASKIDSIHDNYIIFNLDNNEYAQYLIESLIYKGLGNDLDKNNAMHALYSLLVPELVKCVQSELINFNTYKNQDTVQLLNYINQNYKSITLPQLAKKFKYNSNYLGNKLKVDTGKTFQELVDMRKFAVASQLLKEIHKSLHIL